jgi:hypothetical protein
MCGLWIKRLHQPLMWSIFNETAGWRFLHFNDSEVACEFISHQSHARSEASGFRRGAALSISDWLSVSNFFKLLVAGDILGA